MGDVVFLCVLKQEPKLNMLERKAVTHRQAAIDCHENGNSSTVVMWSEVATLLCSCWHAHTRTHRHLSAHNTCRFIFQATAFSALWYLMFSQFSIAFFLFTLFFSATHTHTDSYYYHIFHTHSLASLFSCSPGSPPPTPPAHTGPSSLIITSVFLLGPLGLLGGL